MSGDIIVTNLVLLRFLPSGSVYIFDILIGHFRRILKKSKNSIKKNQK